MRRPPHVAVAPYCLRLGRSAVGTGRYSAVPEGRAGWRLVPLVAAGLCASVPAAAGCIKFAPAKTYPGDQPDWLAVGDLNGDGRPDIAVSDAQYGEIQTLLGRGDGTFRV